MLSAKADPTLRQGHTIYFASLTIRCQILKIPMTRGKCHLFLQSCFSCTFLPPCHCYAVSHSPEMEEFVSIRVHSCPFVSIRVHSWFLLSPLLSFSCISCVSWLNNSFAIRVHSCPFVVPTLPHISFVFFRTTVPYFYEMSAHVLASLAKGDQYRKNTSVTEEKPVFFARLLAKLRQMCYI